MSTMYTWERRIQRARDLTQSRPYSREVMTFYAQVLTWQHQVFERLAAAARHHPFTGSFETDRVRVLEHFASLLDLAARQGSEALAAEANELVTSPHSWKGLLESYWNREPDYEQHFFARACLQPYLEILADTRTAPFDSSRTGARNDEPTKAEPARLCPFCGRKPQLALLSNETTLPGTVGGSAEGGCRFLMCGDCLTTWAYQRIACASCGEEDPYKLAYYASEQIPNIRVDGCDSCKRYLKTVDLTQDRRPVPPVDELSAIPLDLWANNQGFTKIRLNLAGI